MRNQIIEEIYRDTQYISYCRKVCNDSVLADDLFQYLILYLMEMPEGKLEALYNEGNLRNYIARIIYCSINGNRSQFLKEITGNLINIDCTLLPNLDCSITAEKNKLINKVKIILDRETKKCINNGEYPAHVKLLEIYVDHGSFKKVSDLTGIPYKTVRRNIQSLIAKIKDKVND